MDVLWWLFVVVVVVVLAGQRRLREILGFLASAHWLAAAAGSGPCTHLHGFSGWLLYFALLLGAWRTEIGHSAPVLICMTIEDKMDIRGTMGSSRARAGDRLVPLYLYRCASCLGRRCEDASQHPTKNFNAGIGWST